MRRRIAIISSVFTVACAAGASTDVSERIERRASAVIGGIDSDATEDAVVLLMHYDALQSGGATDGCTGVMLTPDLVLTARHCVSVTDASAACREDGTALSGGQVKSDHDASALYAFAGHERPDFISGLAKAARGVEIITTGAATICNSDLALVRLDRPLEGARIAPVRLDSIPAAGELVTVVGWGITAETSFPDTRQTRAGVEITAVGPARALGSAEFTTGEAACAGDSGGPALAASGAVLGVLSRGGNGAGGAGAENCVDGENVFVAVAAYKDVILAAYEKSGQAPWHEGNPNPRLGALGAACEAADECQSALCDPAKNVCTLACDRDACPRGWACTEGALGKTAGGGKICVQQKEEDGGCAITSAASGSRGGAGAVLFAIVIVAARRRRRVEIDYKRADEAHRSGPRARSLCRRVRR